MRLLRSVLRFKLEYHRKERLRRSFFIAEKSANEEKEEV